MTIKERITPGLVFSADARGFVKEADAGLIIWDKNLRSVKTAIKKARPSGNPILITDMDELKGPPFIKNVLEDFAEENTFADILMCLQLGGYAVVNTALWELCRWKLATMPTWTEE